MTLVHSCHMKNRWRHRVGGGQRCPSPSSINFDYRTSSPHGLCNSTEDSRTPILLTIEWRAPPLLFPLWASTTMSHSDEKKSQTSVQVHEALNDIYSIDDAPGLDRVYHAKARLLNQAIQEIGMGKYQVCPEFYPPKTPPTNLSFTVVALRRCRFRVVRGQSVACKYATRRPQAGADSSHPGGDRSDLGPRHQRIFLPRTLPQTWSGKYPNLELPHIHAD